MPSTFCKEGVLFVKPAGDIYKKKTSRVLFIPVSWCLVPRSKAIESAELPTGFADFHGKFRPASSPAEMNDDECQ